MIAVITLFLSSLSNPVGKGVGGSSTSDLCTLLFCSSKTFCGSYGTGICLPWAFIPASSTKTNALSTGCPTLFNSKTGPLGYLSQNREETLKIKCWLYTDQDPDGVISFLDVLLPVIAISLQNLYITYSEIHVGMFKWGCFSVLIFGSR